MKQRILTAVMLMAAAFLAGPQVRADVKPHALFSDGMVLQRGRNCPIWGTAEPGEEIQVELRTPNTTVESATLKASAEGKWKTKLPMATINAGGPYTVVIKGNNTITLKEVYVGDVWICSGQSNMEWPLHLTHNAEQAIKNATNPKIRLFTVPKNTADKPLTAFVGQPKWQACNPDTVKNFSAVGYFFGRDLQKALDVPIGLIHTSWGGTRAEAWTSRPVLEQHEEWKGEFPAYAKAKANYLAALDKYLEDLKRFCRLMEENQDQGSPPTPPAFPRNSNSPSVLYNAMIAPLIPYAIKGAIWYQGESNAGKAYAYRKLFPTMIQNWRDDWKQGDFPFLFRAAGAVAGDRQ